MASTMTLETLMKLAEQGIEIEIRRRITKIIAEHVEPIIKQLASDTAKELLGRVDVSGYSNLNNLSINVLVRFGDK